MSKAMFLLTDNTMKVVEPEVARRAYDMLTGVIDPDERQAEFLTKIKRIFLPPSHRPDNYQHTESPYDSQKSIERPDVPQLADANTSPVPKTSGFNDEYERRYK